MMNDPAGRVGKFRVQSGCRPPHRPLWSKRKLFYGTARIEYRKIPDENPA